jgi:type IV pilus assembly protein PilA
MLARLRKMQEENEEGFTLIELLVVIIIIGILAAIAIPVFLNQRQKGYDAGVKSDLRNAATAEETYLTDNNVYLSGTFTGAPTEALSSAGLKLSTPGDYTNNTAQLTVEFVTSADAKTTTDATSGYCISGTSASGTVFSYDSVKGGLQGKGVACP